MENIQNQCAYLLKKVKRCQLATDLDGFTDAGVIGYFIKLPFKWIYKKNFNEVCVLIEEINHYLQENNVDLKLETFEEYENQSILYGANQLQALACKQYEHRVRYFKRLVEQINQISECISKIDE